MGLVDGKVALVTGAGSGIGRASALKFAQEGGNVIVADISAQSGDETVRRIHEAGGTAAAITCDVTSGSDVAAAVTYAVDTYGRLDCAVNNAGGTGGFAPTADMPETTFDDDVNVNLKGVWLCVKYEIPAMLASGGGSIVNMSAGGGLFGSPMTGAYNAAKHGVNGITKTAALEYAKNGIRVNAVCPGVIHTEWLDRDADKAPLDYLMSLMPIGRMGTPEEIAEAVVWLCSDRASLVTGAILPVDGGMAAD